MDEALFNNRRGAPESQGDARGRAKSIPEPRKGGQAAHGTRRCGIERGKKQENHVGLFGFLKSKRRSTDQETLLRAASDAFLAAMKREPWPGPADVWHKVVRGFTDFLECTEVSDPKTLASRSLAFYMRARALYYAGLYAETIKDVERISPVFCHPGCANLPPKRLRAMANVKLGNFHEAECDLQEEIEDLRTTLARVGGPRPGMIERSDAYYWLLVCKHQGDEKAAMDEQMGW